MNKLIFSLLFVSLFFFTQTVQAKVLPQSLKSVQKSNSLQSKVVSISVAPKLRLDRRALIVNFGNLQNVTNVSYLLTYKTNVQDEGAMGILNLNNSSTQTTELLFGTCSKNVCRYHNGIKDAKLQITYQTKSGKKYSRKFKIKI